ncbi:MAG TPA: hypothetical protein VMZ50_13325 [Phycisphaerae bacterium]|nr:hypothetical protein [Phycisphaerae bacterium]
MRYKNDWPEARERLCALWEGRRTDRCCIAVTAPGGKNAEGPPPPATPQQKWLDPDWLVRDALARLESTWWGGEAIPSYLLLAGWLVCLGGTPRLAMDTIWWERIAVDFDTAPRFAFDPAGPWVRRFEAAYCAMAGAAGKDDFLVGQPCILPASDLLSMLMGTEEFLTALLDHPQWMAEALRQGAGAQVAARRHFRDRIANRHDFWYGSAGWMPFWAPQPYMGTQADVSCMLSPELFDRFVLPELDLYARELGPIWYHLDGGDARQHLPRLLSLPYLRVLQYTPAPCEPPNGPEHLDFYRQVQAAGKIVHVQVPKQNVLPLVKALDPTLLMLQTACDSPREGRELLAAAERTT